MQCVLFAPAIDFLLLMSRPPHTLASCCFPSRPPPDFLQHEPTRRRRMSGTGGQHASVSLSTTHKHRAYHTNAVAVKSSLSRLANAVTVVRRKPHLPSLRTTTYSLHQLPVGSQFWQQLCLEHGIDQNGNLHPYAAEGPHAGGDRKDVFFYQSDDTRYVPRSCWIWSLE
jgi:hypothetical protein